MNKVYDLRSDTFTLPDEGMRQAIYRAEVGDDVYHEDPTVNRLEELAADMLGKKHAVFVSSGSMGNLIGLCVNCGRGNEVLCAAGSHIVHHEISSAAIIAQVMPIQINAPGGILKPSMLEGKVKPRGVYDMGATAMIEVENTIGGNPYPLQTLCDLRAFSDGHGLKIHMDGARLFNAALAEEVSVRDLAYFADDVTVCLSKGLGAPAGSILASDSDSFEFHARRMKKMLGGGMRQSGFLAAAGIYALENNIPKLVADHANAQVLARALADVPWASIDPDKVRTNIILFDGVGIDNENLARQLTEAGLLCLTDGGKVRMVTSLNLSSADSAQAAELIRAFRPVGGNDGR